MAVSSTTAGLVWLRADGTPSGICLPAQLIAEDSGWRRVLPAHAAEPQEKPA